MKKLCLFLFCFVALSQLRAQVYVTSDSVYNYPQTKTQQRTLVQETKKSNSFDASKLEFGGNLGLQFGEYTHVGIEPQIGYKISPYFSAGITLGYNYFSEKYDYDNKDEFSALTMGVYSRVYPIPQIVLSVQPEISRVWYKLDGYSDSGVAPTCLIGGGVRYGGVILMLQYDVVQDKYSPYGNNLIYTAGFCF